MTEENSGYDGTERRSVQLHIVQYIDSRLEKHEEQVRKLINDHTTEEIGRFQDILTRIDRNNELSAERHNTLVAQLSAHLAKTEAMETAFLESDHGGLDYEGHKRYHSTRRKMSNWLDNARNNALTKLIEYVSIAAVVWLGFVVWKAFLVGPH